MTASCEGLVSVTTEPQTQYNCMSAEKSQFLLKTEASKVRLKASPGVLLTNAHMADIKAIIPLQILLMEL